MEQGTRQDSTLETIGRETSEGSHIAWRVLAADIGTTMTKVTVFEKEAGQWRILGKASAPTTVEPPDSDVMIGLREAMGKLETWTGVRLLDGARLIAPRLKDGGVDLFVATSSAGGGLQVLVAGLTKEITVESGHRAALGAGAIVSQILSLRDAGADFDTIERIRDQKVDMILVTGGTDGGNVRDVLSLVELLAIANPTPRAGGSAKMPLVYAGNDKARDYVSEMVGDVMEVTFADNVRPNVETEAFYSARTVIHRIFLNHVMAHAPGFKTLTTWAEGLVKPTPVSVGDALTLISRALTGKGTSGTTGMNLLGVDIGSATTDVYSVINGEFYRTVSAGLGMSSGIGSVPQGTRPQEVAKWLPWEAGEDLVRNWNLNKMLRPTTIPQTPRELVLEQAFAKETLRTALDHHRSLVVGLKGVRKQRMIGDVFNQAGTGESLVNLLRTRIIVGSGGALSGAPRPGQALMMLLDGFEPQGVTDLLADTGAFLAHLGILIDVLGEDGAQRLLEDLMAQGYLLTLGTVVAPVGPRVSPGTTVAKVKMKEASREELHEVIAGELVTIPVNPGAQMEVIPRRDFDVGSGRGYPLVTQVRGGKVGLILDGRGRPLTFPSNVYLQRQMARKWYMALGAYPEEVLLAAD